MLLEVVENQRDDWTSWRNTSCPKGQDIIDITVGARGPQADKNLFHRQQAKFSENQKFVADKAYIGVPRTVTPTKKPKGKELTSEKKAEKR